MRVISLLQSLKDINLTYEFSKRELSPFDQIEKRQCENSFYKFVKTFWHTIEGNNEFVDNWHIEAFCKHLEAARAGLLRFFVCNIPPRCMKSTIKSMFVAWVWTTEPNLRFIHVSGDTNLLIKDNIRSKDIIQSELYQLYWNDSFKIRRDINSKKRFANNKGGVSLVKSIRASSIGEGGNFVILDDANSAQDLDSEKQRQRTLDTFDSTISFRFDSTTKFSLICIQQRLHEFDLSGHILSTRKGVIHFCLPMEYDTKRPCSTIVLPGMTKVWRDPRTKEGELLWPSRFSKDYLENVFKAGLRTPYNIAAQLQQSPYPPDGNILQRSWFQTWEHNYVPQFKEVIQSWDTALSDKESACYSAVTTWGVFENDNGVRQVMLINAWRGQLEQPQLRKMIKKCYYHYYTRSEQGDIIEGIKPTTLLIEEANNSKALIDDLRRGHIPVESFHPRYHGLKNPTTGEYQTSKIGRARLASLVFADQYVWVLGREGKPYSHLQHFIECAIKYPRGDGADYVDSLSQAFIWLMKAGLIHLRGEQPAPPIINWKEMQEQMYDE